MIKFVHAKGAQVIIIIFFWLCKSPPGPLRSLKKCMIKNMISLKRYHKVNITLTYDITFKRQTLHNRKNIYCKHYLKIRALQVNVGEEVDLKRLILPSCWLTAKCKSACIFLTVLLHVLYVIRVYPQRVMHENGDSLCISMVAFLKSNPF